MNLPSPSPDPRDRSVSIIISNWNYGHYVADCIDSALDQSQPADEIIVVDDGSSDGSARALSPYAERVTLVFQRNGGQAAAMNAGFARSTGAIVLFLDADDLLRPEAVETVRTNWFEGLSSLSFGLELIDADGASRGLYEQTILAAQGDNRPELLGWGSFPFAPTSGNSFSREFLRDVLPMDEARWRISADAFLIKAAALYGRMAVIRPVLGAYRTHSANNYYREHAPRNWWIQRGVIDIADALNGLAAMPRLPAASATERELLRLRLRLTSLELRARLMQASGAEPALAPRARSALAMTLLGPLAFRAKLAAALPLSALAIGAGRSRAVQHWLGDARARPAALQWISSLFGDRRLQTEMGRLRSQRYPHTVRFGERLAALSPTPLSRVLAQSWLGEIVEGRYWSAGPHAAFEFRLDATPHTARIEIDVQSGPEWRAEPLGYVAALDGRKLLATDLWDRGIIRLDLPRELRPRDGIIRLQVSCAPPTHALRPWRRRIERPPYFAIHSLRVGIVDAFPDFPFLAEGTLAPFASLLPADPLALGWRRGGDGGARMIGSEASCRVSALASDGNLELVLAQAPPNARGWLRVFCDGVEILSTDASADQELRCRLPTPRQAGARALELRFVFAMHDAMEEIAFGLGHVDIHRIAIADPTRWIIALKLASVFS